MNSELTMRGIPSEGLDAAFQAEETRKSDLILQATLLRERGQEEEASRAFAEAAAVEERLRDRCLELDLGEKASVHAFSAAACWARAGDFYHALVLCDQLLARDGLPERLRRRVAEYAGTLRARRSEWYAALLAGEERREEEAAPSR